MAGGEATDAGGQAGGQRGGALVGQVPGAAVFAGNI